MKKKVFIALSLITAALVTVGLLGFKKDFVEAKSPMACNTNVTVYASGSTVNITDVWITAGSNPTQHYVVSLTNGQNQTFSNSTFGSGTINISISGTNLQAIEVEDPAYCKTWPLSRTNVSASIVKECSKPLVVIASSVPACP